MNALIRKVVKAVGFKWLTGQVRAAAEGKLGPKWQAAYWRLAGQKRWISVVLGLLAGTTALAGYQEAATVLGGIATLGLSLGFVDANWRANPLEDDWLKDSWLWKALANQAPVLTTLLVAALGWLQGGTCTLDQWCGYLSIACTLLGAALVQVGILDAAWQSPAPVKPV